MALERFVTENVGLCQLPLIFISFPWLSFHFAALDFRQLWLKEVNTWRLLIRSLGPSFLGVVFLFCFVLFCCLWGRGNGLNLGQTSKKFMKLITFGDYDLDFISLQELLSCMYHQDLKLAYFQGLRSESKKFILSFPCRQHLWRTDNAIDSDLPDKIQKYEERSGDRSLLYTLQSLSQSCMHCQTGYVLGLLVWENCMVKEAALRALYIKFLC